LGRIGRIYIEFRFYLYMSHIFFKPVKYKICVWMRPMRTRMFKINSLAFLFCVYNILKSIDLNDAESQHNVMNISHL